MRISSVVAHLFLYTLLLVILISGYLISTADGKPIAVFSGFTLPALLSRAGEQVGLDSCGSVSTAWSDCAKHHVIDGDITLKRMSGLRIISPSEKDKGRLCWR